jgi:hypothetical protein
LAISSYAVFFLAAFAVVAAVRSWRIPGARESAGAQQGANLVTASLDHSHVAAKILEDEVKRRWKDEAKARKIEGRDLIIVGWKGDDQLHGNAQYVDSAISGQTSHVDRMVDQFLGQSPHRLILAGEPGSGKTTLAILMMLELLQRRSDHSPVPVMLSLSSWDLQGGLRQWVTHRIVSEYKPENVEEAEWHAAVEHLIRNDLIIPVLDGLDELAPRLRGPALAAINTILPTQPIILACRRKEYEEIARTSGPLTSAAASIALTVSPSEVIRYLRDHPGAVGFKSWEPILNEISSSGTSPVRESLSSPLIVSLLPVVYGPAGSDPSELLDGQRFYSREAIENRLYEGLLHSYDVYYHINVGRRNRWNPTRARKWLTELARHLSRSEIYDIVYWQLPHAVTRNQRLLVALCASLLGGLSAAVIPNLIIGIAAGTLAGMFLGIPLSFIRRRADRPKTRLPVSTGKRGSIFIRANGPLHTVVFCGLAGVLVGLTVHYILQAYFKASPIYPYSGFLTCLCAVIAGTPIGIPGWQPMIVIAQQGSGGSISEQLKADRANNLLFAVSSIITLAIAIMLLGWTWGGFALGTLFGFLAIFIVDKLSMAWWSYHLAMAMLAAGGTFPRRLGKFLDDSYNYGLLRRVGGVYQLRHAGFQDYLAEMPRSPEATLIENSGPRGSAKELHS